MIDPFGDPLGFLSRLILQIPALLVAVTVHEFAHAVVADRLGDPTARRLGRLTLNPLPHIDPLGAIAWRWWRCGCSADSTPSRPPS